MHEIREGMAGINEGDEMRKYAYICDKCGKKEVTEVNNYPKEWHNVEIKIDPSGSYHARFTKDLLLCPECTAKLGYTVEKATPAQAASIENTLYDMAAEIVGNVMQQQG